MGTRLKSWMKCLLRRPPPPSVQLLCKGGSSFRAFCLQTSLHGWHYLVDHRSPYAGGGGRALTCQHAMWAAIVLLAVVTAFTFLYNNTWASSSATLI